MNYKEYSGEKCRKLLQIQDRFKKEINLDSYSNWFYDGESELLRLYNSDEDEIYFRYIPVGSFSLKSKIWMWSWFNESSIEKSKAELSIVKEFGVENKFEKLVEGSFPSDEFDAWELTSICFDFLNAIGVYSVKSGGLKKYMLIMSIEKSASPKIQFSMDKTVECETHGFSRSAFVCQHLNLKMPNGFEESFDTYKGMDLEEDDDLSAWCSECEGIRIENNGWNDKSEKFAKITLVCEKCYFELKAFNKII